MRVDELINELETWHGEMEVIVIDNNCIEHDIEKIYMDIKEKEPRLALKID